jgi:alpha-mannosidase
VRCYETAVKKTDAELTTAFAIREAHSTNVLEAAPKKLSVKDNAIKLRFRPFEIKTVKLFL